MMIEMNFGGGGGTDVSDTTAIESDVLVGKIFHLADGESAVGTRKNIIATDNVDLVAKASNIYIPANVVTTYTDAIRIPAGKYYATLIVAGKTSDFTIWISDTQSVRSSGRNIIVDFEMDEAEDLGLTIYTEVAQYYDIYMVLTKRE